MEDDFFSVAITIPFDADERDCGQRRSLQGHKEARKLIPLIPRLVVPCETAARACSICTSFPLGEKTVRE